MTREFLKKLKPSPVTLILIGLIAYLWFRPPAWVTEQNRPVPEVPVHAGKFMADLHGKVVLVNFWATWCPYCRHEMPAMQAFYQANRSRGFEIVAYSLDKTQAEVDAFMRAEGYAFPAPLATEPVLQAFGGVDRVPLSFVVDRAGIIRHRIAGQVHKGRLESLIEPLLLSSQSPGRPKIDLAPAGGGAARQDEPGAHLTPQSPGRPKIDLAPAGGGAARQDEPGARLIAPSPR